MNNLVKDQNERLSKISSTNDIKVLHSTGKWADTSIWIGNGLQETESAGSIIAKAPRHRLRAERNTKRIKPLYMSPVISLHDSIEARIYKQRIEKGDFAIWAGNLLEDAAFDLGHDDRGIARARFLIESEFISSNFTGSIIRNVKTYSNQNDLDGPQCVETLDDLPRQSMDFDMTSTVIEDKTDSMSISGSSLGLVMIIFSIGMSVPSFLSNFSLMHPAVAFSLGLTGLTFFAMSKIDG